VPINLSGASVRTIARMSAVRIGCFCVWAVPCVRLMPCHTLATAPCCMDAGEGKPRDLCALAIEARWRPMVAGLYFSAIALM
jgi:hypothetical protein